MKQAISNYVRAGYPAIYIVSFEETRVEAVLKSVATETKTAEGNQFQLYGWSLTQGLVDYNTGEGFSEETCDPMIMLSEFDKLPDGSILAARDFHMHLEERNPAIIRKLKDVLTKAKAHNRVFVSMGCALKLPAELEKEIVVVEFSLPDREQLKEVLNGIAAGTPKKDVDPIIDAASGMTTTEAENAFALSIVENGKVLPQAVYREKCNVVKKNGLLEVVTSGTTLDDIGGLEVLKEDLYASRNAFTKEAREYGLPSPRPKFIVGQAGTGKSLTAMAAGTIFNIPLLRLEAGKLFGSLVGQSEANWRSAFATARALGCCVFWIDEADGLFRGAAGSGQTDGGTTERVVKTILQDIQFNSQGILFVFTANDIDGCPDPLIDRCDVWAVELPNQSEREAIWRIQIAKTKRDPKKFDTAALAKATDGFSGRQIEAVWHKALTIAFNDKAREPKSADALTVAKSVVPTSVTMAEVIERRRKRLTNRAQNASAPEKVAASGPRRIAK